MKINDTQTTTSSINISIVEPTTFKHHLMGFSLEFGPPNAEEDTTHTRPPVEGAKEQVRRHLRSETLEVALVPMDLLKSNDVVAANQLGQDSMLGTRPKLTMRNVLK